MKKKERQNLEKKSEGELAAIVQEKRLTALKTAAGLAAGKKSDVRKVKNLRREIAQILTIIRRKQIINVLKSKEEQK